MRNWLQPLVDNAGSHKHAAGGFWRGRQRNRGITRLRSCLPDQRHLLPGGTGANCCWQLRAARGWSSVQDHHQLLRPLSTSPHSPNFLWGMLGGVKVKTMGGKGIHRDLWQQGGKPIGRESLLQSESWVRGQQIHQDQFYTSSTLALPRTSPPQRPCEPSGSVTWRGTCTHQ